MTKLIVVLAIVLVLAALGGFLYLAYGNFPVPTTPVHKVLPDADFPK